MNSHFFSKLCGSLLLCGSLWATTLMAKQVNLSGLDDVAVQDHGRKKPFYVFAVEHLRSISGKESWKDANGETWPAENVVVDVWLRPEIWEDRPLVLVDNVVLKEELKLPKEQKYFSYRALTANSQLDSVLREVARLQVLKEKLSAAQEGARQLSTRLELFKDLANGTAFNFVPDPHEAEGKWLPLTLKLPHYSEQQVASLLASFQQFLKNYDANDEAGVAGSSLAFKQQLRSLAPSLYPSEDILKLENFYTKLDPFSWAWKAYLVSAIVLMLTTQLWRQAGYRFGVALALAGFAFQCAGFVMRVVISDRAPVTNMYETVIWLGFGAMLFALIFELVYRSRYFLLGATPVAFVSLLLAETQNQILDSSIHPLVPVLRSNFWLSTHVLTITSSYAAFALALGIGHIVLGKMLFKCPVPPALYQYLYRALQVGVLLIGTGTILGGVWANYSWGRFWDWDPKETWALITFLCYLVILHGRIAGWWGGVGLAAGSVICFLSVLMAWYGVNFVLGTGLHSYGFGTGGFIYVLGFVMLELIFVGWSLASYLRGQSARQA
ncbi:MAG: cytochrome c biogenesis protein CcsA [Verrucomicrobiales bacterium]|nr:cytochrome c biogenesis protein CcsA [Verrucomicrobiales bacterium]